MVRQDVLDQVNSIFIDVLDKKDINLTDETSARDIEEWDSLAHIHLIVAIERKFNIRFSSKDMQSWENVGEMIDCICEKLMK
ncbi:MAG TPA: acyl carrier protein [Bacteroidales bacterium]|nr:acyl carrier protein [Bacteroidales bacterium]